MRRISRTPKRGLFRAVVTIVMVAGTAVPVKLALAQSDSSAIKSAMDGQERSVYGTMGFDNTRFFSGRIKPGEDWMKIMARGKRDFITEINPQRTALVIVDLQKGSVRAGDAIGAVDKKVGEAFKTRMNNLVLPNNARLLELFRKHDMVVIYLMLNPDTIADSIAPSAERMKRKREFVLVKFSAGAFGTSAIDNILRENGIATLIVTGCDTAGCVLGTIEGANDRTFQTILVEDACVSLRQDYHEAVIKIWTAFGFVRTTDQVINDYPWQNWIDPEVRGRQ